MITDIIFGPMGAGGRAKLLLLLLRHSMRGVSAAFCYNAANFLPKWQ